jgi:hypothetical protein
MARIRTIKPEFYTDENIAELTLWARFLFPALWLHADVDGRLEDRPKFLKTQIAPYDDVNVDQVLQELHDAGFIDRYKVDGKGYVEIKNFRKHQRITGRESDGQSEFPARPKPATGEIVETPGENSETPSNQSETPVTNPNLNLETPGDKAETPGEIVETPDVQEGKGRERKGKEGDGESARATEIERWFDFPPEGTPPIAVIVAKALTDVPWFFPPGAEPPTERYCTLKADWFADVLGSDCDLDEVKAILQKFTEWWQEKGKSNLEGHGETKLNDWLQRDEARFRSLRRSREQDRAKAGFVPKTGLQLAESIFSEEVGVGA